MENKQQFESFYEHYNFLLGDSIPSGYSLTISSWENDADNPKDVTIYGLESADVVFLVKFFERFKSSSYDEDLYFGNQELTNELNNRIREHLKETLAQYPPSTPIIVFEMKSTVDEEWDLDFIGDIIGVWNSDHYRVMDGYQIRLVRTPIVDETESFSQKFLGGYE